MSIASAITYKIPKRRHPAVQFMLHQPLGAAGLLFIVLMAFAAVFAPWVTPYDPLAVDYGGMLAAPSWQHWMGTDSYGRDVFTRIVYGSQISLAVSIGATFLAIIPATTFGMMCAYFRGPFDMIFQRDRKSTRLNSSH